MPVCNTAGDLLAALIEPGLVEAGLLNRYWKLEDEHPNSYFLCNWLDRMSELTKVSACCLSESLHRLDGFRDNGDGDPTDECIEMAKEWEADLSKIQLHCRARCCSGDYGDSSCFGRLYAQIEPTLEAKP